MNEHDHRAVIQAATRKELLLACIVAAAAGDDDDIDLRTLLRLQAHQLRWKRPRVLRELGTLIEQGQVSIDDGVLPSPDSPDAGDEDVYLRPGSRFDPAREAALAGVARWLVDSDGARQAGPTKKSRARRSAVDVQARRKLVMDELRDASRNEAVRASTLADALRNRAEFAPFLPARNTSKPADEADRTQDNSLKRLIQRDLEALVDTGEAERVGDKYQATRTEQLSNLAAPAALLMLQTLAEDVFPADMKEKLEAVFQNARRSLEKFTDFNQPENRWIRSLRITSAHHELDEPVIRQDVKNHVHDAIYRKRQVELVAAVSIYEPGSSSPSIRTFKSTGAISHLMLEVPGRLAIEFWPQGQDHPLRIRLADIHKIRVTTVAAHWPDDHEPEGTPSHWSLLSGDAFERDDGKALFVLRVREAALAHFRTRQIGQIMETEEDDDQWHWVRFRARVTPFLLRYLMSIPDVVVLRPLTESHAARYRMHRALADQEACHPQMLRLRLEERREEGHTDQYLSALEHSAEWQQCPSLIEYLVDRLFFANPFGYEPDEVHEDVEMQQYLAIATSAYRRIASTPVTTRADLARLLQQSTSEHAGGRKVVCNWDALADECWDALNDYHMHATSHPFVR